MAYNKYKAKPVIIDGIRFASQTEGQRYLDLKNLKRAGVIRDLELQPEFELWVKEKKVCVYRGDFAYFETANDNYVVEDVKGYPTDEYKLKRKLLLALNPTLDHREIGIRPKRERKTRPDIKDLIREETRRRT